MARSLGTGAVERHFVGSPQPRCSGRWTHPKGAPKRPGNCERARRSTQRDGVARRLACMEHRFLYVCAMSRGRTARKLVVALTLTAISLVAATEAAAVPGVVGRPYALVRPNSNVTDVLVRGTDNNVWLRTRTGSSWGGWTNLGGNGVGRPAAISWGPNHLDVFTKDANSRLVHRYWNGTTWSSWEALGTFQLAGDPVVTSWGNGRIDIFARGTDNALIHNWYDGLWRGWEHLGGVMKFDPTVVSLRPGHLDAFVIGSDYRLYHRWSDNAPWVDWSQLGSAQFTSSPSAIYRPGSAPAAIDVFAAGSDNALMQTSWNSAVGWQPTVWLDGSLRQTPEVVANTSTETVFVRGADARLWQRWRGTGAWSAWQKMGDWEITTDPAAVWTATTGDVFARGNDAALIVKSFDSSGWRDWQSLGAPDPYPTSTQYGGDNLAVDNDAEVGAVLTALGSASSDAAWLQIWNGLSPADQARVQQGTVQQDDTLLRDVSSGRVYLYAGGAVAWITTPAVAGKLEYDLSTAKTVASSVIARYRQADPITDAALSAPDEPADPDWAWAPIITLGVNARDRPHPRADSGYFWVLGYDVVFRSAQNETEFRGTVHWYRHKWKIWKYYAQLSSGSRSQASVPGVCHTSSVGSSWKGVGFSWGLPPSVSISGSNSSAQDGFTQCPRTGYVNAPDTNWGNFRPVSGEGRTKGAIRFLVFTECSRTRANQPRKACVSKKASRSTDGVTHSDGSPPSYVTDY